MTVLSPADLKRAGRLKAKISGPVAPPGQAVTRMVGTVTATGTSPSTVTLDLGGDTDIAGVRYLASYTPAAGDVVVVLAAGTDWIVLGKVKA